MEIEIARDSNMAMGGNSLLRSLQNNTTPRLDLFVRESVQNSLDAGKGGPVEVRFETGDVDPLQIAGYFDGIEQSLLRQPANRSRYLAVRDYGTEGLSGPARLRDIRNGERGNLRKLVYEIGKAQTMAGAGGSWGLGKTTAYRMGIGLVVYYSRFYNSEIGQYESRLAATMVEDETADQGILPAPGDGSMSRGIAWWGERDEMDSNHESTIPVTDEHYITAFLGYFGLKPYEGQETGTTIIIPFVDEDALLRETRPAVSSDADATPYSAPWTASVAEFLKVAVQRWYAPRLENKASFGERILQVWVNGKPIGRNSMEPFFELVQTLYITGKDPNVRQCFREARIETAAIRLNKTFLGEALAGTVAFAEVSADDLGMTPPDNNPDPITYIGGMTSDSDRPDPIVLYARSPGMVVSYETSGDWVPRLSNMKPGHFIIGVFVPKSNAVLRVNGMKLEEYLREGEIADHMKWQDRTIEGIPQSIVSRMKTRVQKHMEHAFQERPQPADERRRDYGIGRALAEVLMPPTGFGAWDKRRGGETSGPGGTGGRGKNPSVEHPVGAHRTKSVSIKQVGPATWNGNTVSFPVRINMGMHNSASLYVRIETESGAMDAGSWENIIGTPSPVSLVEFQIDNAYREPSRKRRGKNAQTARKRSSVSCECRNRYTGGFHTFCGVDLTVEKASGTAVIEGTVVYSADRSDGSISVKVVEAP